MSKSVPTIRSHDDGASSSSNAPSSSLTPSSSLFFPSGLPIDRSRRGRLIARNASLALVSSSASDIPLSVAALRESTSKGLYTSWHPNSDRLDDRRDIVIAAVKRRALRAEGRNEGEGAAGITEEEARQRGRKRDEERRIRKEIQVRKQKDADSKKKIAAATANILMGMTLIKPDIKTNEDEDDENDSPMSSPQPAIAPGVVVADASIKAVDNSTPTAILRTPPRPSISSSLSSSSSHHPAVSASFLSPVRLHTSSLTLLSAPLLRTLHYATDRPQSLMTKRNLVLAMHDRGVGHESQALMPDMASASAAAEDEQLPLNSDGGPPLSPRTLAKEREIAKQKRPHGWIQSGLAEMINNDRDERAVKAKEAKEESDRMMNMIKNDDEDEDDAVELKVIATVPTLLQRLEAVSTLLASSHAAMRLKTLATTTMPPPMTPMTAAASYRSQSNTSTSPTSRLDSTSQPSSTKTIPRAMHLSIAVDNDDTPTMTPSPSRTKTPLTIRRSDSIQAMNKSAGHTATPIRHSSSSNLIATPYRFHSSSSANDISMSSSTASSADALLLIENQHNLEPIPVDDWIRLLKYESLQDFHFDFHAYIRSIRSADTDGAYNMDEYVDRHARQPSHITSSRFHHSVLSVLSSHHVESFRTEAYYNSLAALDPQANRARVQDGLGINIRSDLSSGRFQAAVFARMHMAERAPGPEPSVERMMERLNELNMTRNAHWVRQTTDGKASPRKPSAEFVPGLYDAIVTRQKVTSAIQPLLRPKSATMKRQRSAMMSARMQETMMQRDVSNERIDTISHVSLMPFHQLSDASDAFTTPTASAPSTFSAATLSVAVSAASTQMMKSKHRRRPQSSSIDQTATRQSLDLSNHPVSFLRAHSRAISIISDPSPRRAQPSYVDDSKPIDEPLPSPLDRLSTLNSASVRTRFAIQHADDKQRQEEYNAAVMRATAGDAPFVVSSSSMLHADKAPPLLDSALTLLTRTASIAHRSMASTREIDDTVRNRLHATLDVEYDELCLRSEEVTIRSEVEDAIFKRCFPAGLIDAVDLDKKDRAINQPSSFTSNESKSTDESFATHHLLPPAPLLSQFNSAPPIDDDDVLDGPSRVGSTSLRDVPFAPSSSIFASLLPSFRAETFTLAPLRLPHLYAPHAPVQEYCSSAVELFPSSCTITLAQLDAVSNSARHVGKDFAVELLIAEHFDRRTLRRKRKRRKGKKKASIVSSYAQSPSTKAKPKLTIEVDMQLDVPFLDLDLELVVRMVTQNFMYEEADLEAETQNLVASRGELHALPTASSRAMGAVDSLASFALIAPIATLAEMTNLDPFQDAATRFSEAHLKWAVQAQAKTVVPVGRRKVVRREAEYASSDEESHADHADHAADAKRMARYLDHSIHAPLDPTATPTDEDVDRAMRDIYLEGDFEPASVHTQTGKVSMPFPSPEPEQKSQARTHSSTAAAHKISTIAAASLATMLVKVPPSPPSPVRSSFLLPMSSSKIGHASGPSLVEHVTTYHHRVHNMVSNPRSSSISSLTSLASTLSLQPRDNILEIAQPSSLSASDAKAKSLAAVVARAMLVDQHEKDLELEREEQAQREARASANRLLLSRGPPRTRTSTKLAKQPASAAGGGNRRLQTRLLSLWRALNMESRDMLYMLEDYTRPHRAAELSAALELWEKCAELWNTRRVLIKKTKEQMRPLPLTSSSSSKSDVDDLTVLTPSRVLVHACGGLDDHAFVFAVTIQLAHAARTLYAKHGDLIVVAGRPLMLRLCAGINWSCCELGEQVLDEIQNMWTVMQEQMKTGKGKGENELEAITTTEVIKPDANPLLIVDGHSSLHSHSGDAISSPPSPHLLYHSSEPTSPRSLSASSSRSMFVHPAPMPRHSLFTRPLIAGEFMTLMRGSSVVELPDTGLQLCAITNINDDDRQRGTTVPIRMRRRTRSIQVETQSYTPLMLMHPTPPSSRPTSSIPRAPSLSSSSSSSSSSSLRLTRPHTAHDRPLTARRSAAKSRISSSTSAAVLQLVNNVSWNMD